MRTGICNSSPFMLKIRQDVSVSQIVAIRVGLGERLCSFFLTQMCESYGGSRFRFAIDKAEDPSIGFVANPLESQTAPLPDMT